MQLSLVSLAEIEVPIFCIKMNAISSYSEDHRDQRDQNYTLITFYNCGTLFYCTHGELCRLREVYK